MQIGMIGPGRMGASMTRRLLRGDHECVVHDAHAEAMARLVTLGARATTSLHDLIEALAPRPARYLAIPPSLFPTVIEGLAPARNHVSSVQVTLAEHPPAIPYARGSWGPPAANHLIAADGGWHNLVAAS